MENPKKTKKPFPDHIKPYLLRIPKTMHAEIKEIGFKSGHVVNRQIILAIEYYINQHKGGEKQKK